MNFANHSVSISLRALVGMLGLTAFAVAVSAQTVGSRLENTPLVTGPMGVSVSVNDILAELQKEPEQVKRNTLVQPAAVQQISNNLILRRVLAKEAERDGLAKEPITAAALQIAQDRVLSDARLAKLDQQNAPTDAAMEAYARNVYNANLDKFQVPEQIHVRHILLANEGEKSLAKAKKLLNELKAGANFEELAKANSIDSSNAEKGGDLGFFGPGKMVRPFELAAFALAKPGDLSEPVATQFGYHIIKMEERKEKSVLKFEELKVRLMDEAKVGLINEARIQKVFSLSNDFKFDAAAISALVKANTP